MCNHTDENSADFSFNNCHSLVYVSRNTSDYTAACCDMTGFFGRVKLDGVGLWLT
jgi:hypothetical protein